MSTLDEKFWRTHKLLAWDTCSCSASDHTDPPANPNRHGDSCGYRTALATRHSWTAHEVASVFGDELDAGECKYTLHD